MSQTQTHAAPVHSAKDRAKDAQKLLALLAADWLHGDRHNQAEIRALTLDLLTDLGADGAEAKERLTAEVPA